jgi:hypothetical protein
MEGSTLASSIYKKKNKYVHDSHEGRGNLPSTAKTAAVNEASAPPKSPSVSRPINCKKKKKKESVSAWE